MDTGADILFTTNFHMPWDKILRLALANKIKDCFNTTLFQSSQSSQSSEDVGFVSSSHLYDPGSPICNSYKKRNPSGGCRF